MGLTTCAGQTVNVEPGNYSGVKIVVECAEDVCERYELHLSEDEWKALTIQGFAAIRRGGE